MWVLIVAGLGRTPIARRQLDAQPLDFAEEGRLVDTQRLGCRQAVEVVLAQGIHDHPALAVLEIFCRAVLVVW